MSGMTEILGMTEMEKAEFSLARQKLYEKLLEMSDRVKGAIDKAEESGEVFGVDDIIYGMSVDVVAKAFTDANKPIVEAAKRKGVE